MTLLEAFDVLPKSESTLLKWSSNGKLSFQVLNDTEYGPCMYRIVVSGEELGAVKYYGGRKLACYEKAF